MPIETAVDCTPSLADLIEGRASALNQIIARWQRPLVAFAYRYTQNRTDAQDLVAEAFAKLYLHRQRLQPDTRIHSWLFATLANLCRNHRRWQHRHPAESIAENEEFLEQRLDNSFLSSVPQPIDALQQDEAVAALRAAINELPHDLKTTVLLHHYEHLSYREIAKIVDCSERGVETRLYRAKQQLRDALAKWL